MTFQQRKKMLKYCVTNYNKSYEMYLIANYFPKAIEIITKLIEVDVGKLDGEYY